MPHIKRGIVVPCPGGIPLKRIHSIKCRCGHGFTIDIGPRWKKGLVVKCSRCDEVVARATEDSVVII